MKTWGWEVAAWRWAWAGRRRTCILSQPRQGCSVLKSEEPKTAFQKTVLHEGRRWGGANDAPSPSGFWRWLDYQCKTGTFWRDVGVGLKSARLNQKQICWGWMWGKLFHFSQPIFFSCWFITAANPNTSTMWLLLLSLASQVPFWEDQLMLVKHVNTTKGDDLRFWPQASTHWSFYPAPFSFFFVLSLSWHLAPSDPR